jgi:hypothetical protein
VLLSSAELRSISILNVLSASLAELDWNPWKYGQNHPKIALNVSVELDAVRKGTSFPR